MMLYRTMEARARTKFKKNDLLICGAASMTEIIAKVQQSPDPNRVIFIDSPDVMAGGTSEGRRFAIEAIYREMVRLKGMCKLVVVASQTRRKDGRLALESVSEAWSKVHYSDMVLSLTRLGSANAEGDPNNGQRSVRLSVHKNRFGVTDRYIPFVFDYGDLSWQSTGTPMFEGSEEDMEDAEY
jgi:predicted ATP-dependent serine protease